MITPATLKITRLAQPFLSRRFCNHFSSSGSDVNVTIDDKTGFATLELNRPPVNSLSLEFSLEISQKIAELRKKRINGLIITSASNKIFCGGFHIHEMHKPDLDRAEKAWRALQGVWYSIYSAPFPTAAAINGHSPAGGCMMALACDYRVMLKNFTIGLNEVQLGLEVPAWLYSTMRNVISRRDTEFALTTGKLFSTAEAMKVGLVDETADTKDEAFKKCEKFIDQFKNVDPEARARTKLALRSDHIEHFLATREEDVKMFLKDVQQERFQAGISAYLDALKKKQKK